MILRLNYKSENITIKKKEQKQRKEIKGKKVRKVIEHYVSLLTIKIQASQAVQAAMKIALNLRKILNLIVEEKKVKVLMMEVKQNNKKLKKKRRIKKQGLFKKKRYKQERNK